MTVGVNSWRHGVPILDGPSSTFLSSRFLCLRSPSRSTTWHMPTLDISSASAPSLTTKQRVNDSALSCYVIHTLHVSYSGDRHHAWPQNGVREAALSGFEGTVLAPSSIRLSGPLWLITWWRAGNTLQRWDLSLVHGRGLCRCHILYRYRGINIRSHRAFKSTAAHYTPTRTSPTCKHPHPQTKTRTVIESAMSWRHNISSFFVPSRHHQFANTVA